MREMEHGNDRPTRLIDGLAADGPRSLKRWFEVLMDGPRHRDFTALSGGERRLERSALSRAVEREHRRRQRLRERLGSERPA